jgi:hypothetical protein
LNRTAPDVIEFESDIAEGKNRLYNILRAYANLDREIGYCQGMNFIAAMLLINIQDEEKAFWCLVSIMMPSSGGNLGLTGLHNWRSCFDLEMSRVKILELELKNKL